MRRIPAVFATPGVYGLDATRIARRSAGVSQCRKAQFEALRAGEAAAEYLVAKTVDQVLSTALTMQGED